NNLSLLFKMYFQYKHYLHDQKRPLIFFLSILIGSVKGVANPWLKSPDYKSGLTEGNEPRRQMTNKGQVFHCHSICLLRTANCPLHPSCSSLLKFNTYN